MTITPPLLVGMGGGKPRPSRLRLTPPKESKLHADVAALLRDHCLPGWKWRHISAKASNAREGAIMKRMGVQAGWPDFILIDPAGTVRFIELKRLGEDLSSAQRNFFTWCQHVGCQYAIVYNICQVGQVLDNWQCLRIRFGKSTTE